MAENQAEKLKIQEKLAKAKARSEVCSTMQDHAFVKMKWQLMKNLRETKLHQTQR